MESDAVSGFKRMIEKQTKPIGYAGVLSALRSIPWDLAKEVTPIEPRAFKHLAFFPGRKGYSGTDFPVHGVMLVGNNYDNLDCWNKEKDEESASPTWKRLRAITFPVSKVPCERFWFTNYCHGVMRSKNSRYEFPPRIRTLLEFRRVFEECVVAMQPKVIVSLGGFARHYLKFERGEAKPQTIMGHETLVLAAYHPAAGGTLDKFKEDAARIGRAYFGDAAWEAM